MDAEVAGDLVDSEEAPGAQSFGVAAQLVIAAKVQHDQAGEGLALAGTVTGGVEDVGD